MTIPTDHTPDPAGWNRIQELERRLNNVVIAISHARTPDNPLSLTGTLDVIEDAALGRKRINPR